MKISDFLNSGSRSSSIRLVLLITAINANIIALLITIAFIYISAVNKSIDITQMTFLILTLLGTALSGKVAQKGFEKGDVKSGDSTEVTDTK